MKYLRKFNTEQEYETAALAGELTSPGVINIKGDTDEDQLSYNLPDFFKFIVDIPSGGVENLSIIPTEFGSIRGASDYFFVDGELQEDGTTEIDLDEGEHTIILSSNRKINSNIPAFHANQYIKEIHFPNSCIRLGGLSAPGVEKLVFGRKFYSTGDLTYWNFPNLSDIDIKNRQFKKENGLILTTTSSGLKTVFASFRDDFWWPEDIQVLTFIPGEESNYNEFLTLGLDSSTPLVFTNYTFPESLRVLDGFPSAYITITGTVTFGPNLEQLGLYNGYNGEISSMGCSTVVFTSPTPPELLGSPNSCFSDVNLKVPQEYLSTYQEWDETENFASISAL